MNLKLVVVEGASTREFFLKEEKKHLLGRTKSCDFLLDCEGISREHCHIWLEESTVWIKDANSSNGTKINDKKIFYATELKVNDIVKVGTVKLKLLLANRNSQIIYSKKKDEPTFTLSSAKATKHLTLLHSIGKSILNTRSILELAKEILENILAMFGCERGCIVVKTAIEGDFQYVYCNFRDHAFTNEKFALSNSILATSLEKGIGTVSADTLSDFLLSSSSSIRNLEIRSILCTCVEGQNRNLGAIYLDSKDAGTFDKSDLDLITAIGRQLALTIERSFLEKELITSQQYSIIEHSRDIIYRCDLNFRFNIISPSVQTILGFSQEQMLKSPETWKLCVHSEDKDALELMRKDVLLGKECYLKYRLKTHSTEVIWVEESCYGIKNADGKLISIQGVVKNITTTKRLEEKLNRAQKMESLGLLAGGVAHDLNNILGGIVTYPDIMLLQLPDNSPFRPYVSGMKKSGLLAAQIVQDLLTMARQENYSMGSLDLNEVVLNYVDSLELKNLCRASAGVQVKTQLSPNRLYIFGSSIHLTKVLMNLVVNAFHAMAGNGLLEISTDWIYLDKKTLKYDYMAEGEYAILTVTDTGEGIQDEDIERIFEPFYSKKLDKGGTGLGLAITYGVVKDHSGYIDVESSLGEGTIFTVYIPLQRNIEETVAIVDTNLSGNESILVVDDVLEQRELVKNILVPLGYKIHLVPSGIEALAFLILNKVDLVLLDMIMEKSIDGLDTYRKIIGIVPQQKVIIVSGFSKSERLKEALDLGVKAYIKKPYALETLGNKIREVLSN